MPAPESNLITVLLRWTMSGQNVTRAGRRWAVSLAALSLAVVAAGCSSSGAAGTSTSATTSRSVARTPTVTGPVTGGKGQPALLDLTLKPATYGYSVDEYFLQGTATAYQPVGPLGVDGKWQVKESTTAPYKTRMVMWKPQNPADFDGTVFVEWLNVSAGFDVPFDWFTDHNYVLDEHAAWIGVSAQAAGIVGGPSIMSSAAAPPGGLKTTDPVRYASLSHPGDGYSYDIFSQAGLAVRGDGKGVNPLAGYQVKRVIADGESQSAFRLTSYVDAVQPLAKVYDGFFIHSRGGDAASLAINGESRGDRTIPNGVKIRDDVDVPVMMVQTESDVRWLGYASATQPDSDNFRLWEIAGGSHVDAYNGLGDDGDGAAEAALLGPTKLTHGPLACASTINAGVQQPVVVAALAGLEKWVRDGTPPPSAARLELTGSGDNINIARDAHGIAVGGVRTPLVDVPVVRNTGEVNTGASPFCAAFGTSSAFDATTLAQLYPHGGSDYVAAFAKDADQTVKAGFWLASSARNWKAAAAAVAFN